MIKLTDIEKTHVFLPSRKSDGHKGDFGHIYAMGGSVGMSGAICLTTVAALRMGSGLVTAIIPDVINEVFEIKNTECMSVPLKSADGCFDTITYSELYKFLSRADCLAFGMGVGRNENINNILKSILNEYTGKLLIDADGLFALTGCLGELKKTNADVVLTPHAMEFSRISGYSLDEINNRRRETAESFAGKYGVTLVLKGKNTIVTNGDCMYINHTGNSGMATAGSGDVLSGIIASLVGQKMNMFNAAATGVFLHGLSGDIAAELTNEYYIIASDIINYLDKAVNMLLKGDV